MRLIYVLFALISFGFTGCATVISEGPGHDTAEVRRAISILAKVTQEDETLWYSWYDPFIVTYSDVPSWYGPYVVGYTPIPRRAWVLKDVKHQTLCTDALLHEGLHTYLWKKLGDPDEHHTNLKVWKMKKPSDPQSFEYLAKVEACK